MSSSPNFKNHTANFKVSSKSNGRKSSRSWSVASTRPPCETDYQRRKGSKKVISFKGSAKRRLSKSFRKSSSRYSHQNGSHDHEDDDNGLSSKRKHELRKILRASRDGDSCESDHSTHSSHSRASDTSITDSECNSESKRENRRRKAVAQCPRECCRKKDNGIDDGLTNFYEQNLPAAVIAVANRMKESAFNRKKEQTKDKLNSIMHRITMALHHSGNDMSDTKEKDDMTSQEIIVYGMPDYDIEREREKRDTRQKVVEVFRSSMKSTKKKVDLITDLEEWMATLQSNQQNDEKDVESHETRVHDTDAIHKKIVSSISKLRGSSNKLAKIAKSIAIAKSACKSLDKSGDVEENNTGATQDKNMTSKRVFTVQELSDRKNWQMAAKKLTLDLEETVRTTHQDPNRKLLQNITKQFKIFSTVIDRKSKDIADYETQLAEKGAALQKAVSSCKKAEEKIKIDAQQLQKFEEENSSMKNKLSDLQEKLEQATSSSGPKKKRERRKSVLLPGASGLAKPNSTAAEFKEETEATTPEISIAEKIKSRLAILDEGQNNSNSGVLAASNLATHDVQENDISAPKKSTEGQPGRSLKSEQGPQQISLAVDKPVTKQGEIMLQQLIPQVPKEADPSVIKTLEDTIDCLRLDLADARKVLEDQALKIIELEAEASEKDEFERRLDQAELEKAELNKSLEASLLQYQRELENRQKTADELLDTVENMRNTVTIKEDQIDHLQRCLDTMTADVQTLLDEKLALEQQQQNQTVTIELEGGLSKQQMLIKMKNQYELELQKLRDFLAREHHRYLAETRKNVTQHHNDINTIHRGSMQLLRTVNRFKESIASILERESLAEAAFEMRRLESLPTDMQFGSSAETKQLLSKMAHQATELLVSLENKLSKALLNRRIEVKEAATAKGFILRDLETNLERLRRARESEAIQIEKYKKLDSVHTTLANEYHDLTSKYKALQKELAPYQQLIESHILLKKEMERLQQENNEAVKKSTQQMNEIEKDRAQLQRVVKSQQQIISKLSMGQLPRVKNRNKREQRYAQRTASMFFIARDDQRKNLDRLDEAFANDEIDSRIHEKTVSMINKAMDLPRVRLVHLVERYVAYKKMEMIKQVLKAALVKYKNNIRLTNYINEMNKRIESKNKKWEARKAELVEYRAAVILQLMDTLSAVKNETGLLLVEPLRKQQSLILTPKRGRGLLPKINKESLEPLEETIVGKSLKPQEETTCTLWRQPDFSGDNPTITMPRIVDLDINRWKYTARSTLVGDVNEMKKLEVSKARMEKIKMAYASKLTLPPIASIYPENPPKQDL